MAAETDAVFRSYDPIKPCMNRTVQERTDKDTLSKHQFAVRGAKTVLDTKQPRVYIHQHLKLKKLQLEEERLATIERDNRLLLERIAKIMRTTGSIDNNNMDREIKSSQFPRLLRSYIFARPSSAFAGAGMESDKDESNYDRYNNFINRRVSKAHWLTPSNVYANKVSASHCGSSAKSLSIEKRQRELLRITQENKQILNRIMARKTKSDYSRLNWEPKWNKEEYYMAQLSRFQPVSQKSKGKEPSQEKLEPQAD